MKTRKTAGTSIEMYLEPLCAPRGHTVVEKTMGREGVEGIIGHRSMWDGEKNIAEVSMWREHLPVWEARKALGRETWKEYFRFTSVRNPFDRAVSMFHWLHDFYKWPAFHTFKDMKDGFQEFILHSGEYRDDRSIVHRKGKYWMKGAIRFEHLADDLHALCKRLNLPIAPTTPIPRTKSQTSRPKDVPVVDYFTTATTDAVLRAQSWVFDRFDYSAEPKDA